MTIINICLNLLHMVGVAKLVAHGGGSVSVGMSSLGRGYWIP